MYEDFDQVVYGNFGVADGVEGVKSVKRSPPRWIGHVRRMPEDRRAKGVQYIKEELQVCWPVVKD